MSRKSVTITDVVVLDGFRVRLTFDDGVEKDVDLDRYLHGPIFEPLREEPALFRTVEVDPEAGTVVWANGADMDPNVLYYDFLEPAWMAEPQVHRST